MKREINIISSGSSDYISFCLVDAGYVIFVVRGDLQRGVKGLHTNTILAYPELKRKGKKITYVYLNRYYGNRRDKSYKDA